ncbi:MAG: transcriptional repressor NrdR [Clostridia bacterium]|nr:transcriptional repressor NrdR [Clostridia bacterium]
MKCPVCSFSDSRVLDSRPIDDGASIKRRRECPSCGKRFTTYEVVDTVPIAVLKRDGRREFFDKHKLALGIERACQKRPVDSKAMAASIEAELQNSIINEISSTDIGEMVLARLKEIDIISYIRFASVYREFKDIDSFTEEIKRLSRKPRRRQAEKSNVTEEPDNG